jgi:hypothetical protein
MQKIKKKNFPAILAAISLILSIASCKTTPRVEYIYETPDIVFPVFPAPDSVTYDDETDMVSMPLWYWQKIAEYKIDVDAIESYINQLRKIGNITGADSGQL